MSWIAWDTLCCMNIIFSFLKFFVFVDGITANDLFQANAFCKGYSRKQAKDFLWLWFDCNMCQCFVRISFKFGNAALYITDSGMHCLSWHFCCWNIWLRWSWSTFWLFCIVKYFLYPLLTNCSVSFLEWLWPPWYVDRIHWIRSAWL